MVEIASDPLAGFQFSTIGQAPSLFDRISDAIPRDAGSPSPSPLSSPRMAAPGNASESHSRLLKALAPESAPLSKSQESSFEATQARPLAVANGLPPRPLTTVAGPSSVPEQRRTPTASVQGPSRTRTSASVKLPSSALPQRPCLAPIATKALSAPSGPGASNVLGLGVTSPASMNPSRLLGDDPIELYRQQLRRLEMAMEEYRQRQEATRQAMANERDQAARWHARADNVMEDMVSMLAAAEQRIAVAEQRAAQLARFEEEAPQCAEQLREARDTVARLEETNATLRKELEEVRIQAAEQERLDKVRVAEAIAKAEDALKRVATHEHERELGEVLIRKKAQEDRARWETEERELRAFWEARERALMAQLEEQKREATANIHALEERVKELERGVELAKHRRIEELYEEKRKLEERLQAQMAQQDQEPRASRTTPTSAVATSFPSASSTSPPLSSHLSAAPAALPMEPTSARDVKEQHISTSMTAPQGSVVASPSIAKATLSTLEGKPLTEFPDLSEPLLAVKAEDEKFVVKPEVRSPLPDHPSHPLHSLAERMSIPNVQEPRREQSLDYAPTRELPGDAILGSPGMPSGSSTLSGPTAASHVGEAHPVSQPLSPDISLGADSPETNVSFNPTLPLFLPSSSESSVQPAVDVLASEDAQVAPGRDSAPSSARPVAPVRIRRPPQSIQQPSASLPRPPTPPIQRDGRPRSWAPRGDHYSPPPRSQGEVHLSGRDRHKRGRDDEIPTDAPNSRRPRLIMDSYRPGYQSSSREIPNRTERRGRTPSPPPVHARSHFEPPTHGQPHYNEYSYRAPRSNEPFSYEEQQPRPDRAHTPPGSPDHPYPLPQYAPPEPPTAMNDAEAWSSPQVDFAVQPFAHAGGANAQPRVAPAKKPPSKRNAAPGPREPPVRSPHQPADGSEEISLLARMQMSEDGVAGEDAEAYENGRRPARRRHQAQDTLIERITGDTEDGGGRGGRKGQPAARGTNARGGRGRGRGSTRGHPGHGPQQNGTSHSKPLADRFSDGKSLKDRLTEASHPAQ
ncbi:hypothetical protein L226DRAFT_560880 [Lentinus tigrinus ALCF2SS1-7]|uniref:uncharacterized protein n=1 Tax=Lentinus tigrinus ALCF2SS1-7 TaxID=1328758 RepID=UPI00116600B0|nr:hypothetical protein L226DRAFT_560880 [Lentinus tigrinus ALCF2SS1-7]